MKIKANTITLNPLHSHVSRISGNAAFDIHVGIPPY